MTESYLSQVVADGAPSPKTLAAYREGLACFKAWCDGRDPVTFGRQDIEGYRHALLAKYARSTVALRLSICKLFYRALVRSGVRPDNPADGVKAPKFATHPADRILSRSLSPQEAGRMVAAMPEADSRKTARDRAVIILMLSQGLRAAEVASLSEGDLDAVGLSWLRVKGKGAKERVAVLQAFERKALTDYLNLRGPSIGPDSPLFLSESGTMDHLTVRTIEAIADAALSRAGLKMHGRSAHCLRHTYAVLATLGGARPESLQMAMGHSSNKTTNHYALAAARWQQNPSECVGKALAMVGNA